MVKQHLSVITGKQDDGIVIDAVFLQRSQDATQLMVDMGDCRIVAGHGILSHSSITAAVYGV